MNNQAITRACELAGSQSALARMLKLTPQTVQRWCAIGHVPAERVLEIEKATGVSRHELRPDIYPIAA